jgi:hypothetical protein
MRRLGFICLLAALAGPVAGLVAEPQAQASVSIAVALDELVARSSSVAMVTPFEARMLWEDGRIYTYTHVHVDTAVGGKLAQGDEPWVRTMGGVVNGTGQVVDGEAVLTTGRPALLFLHVGPPGALEVTARGQGQYAIRLDEKQQPRLVQSSSAGGGIMPRLSTMKPLPLATEILHKRPVADGLRDIQAAWSRLHAR